MVSGSKSSTTVTVARTSSSSYSSSRCFEVVGVTPGHSSSSSLCEPVCVNLQHEGCKVKQTHHKRRHIRPLSWWRSRWLFRGGRGVAADGMRPITGKRDRGGLTSRRASAWSCLSRSWALLRAASAFASLRLWKPVRKSLDGDEYLERGGARHGPSFRVIKDDFGDLLAPGAFLRGKDGVGAGERGEIVHAESAVAAGIGCIKYEQLMGSAMAYSNPYPPPIAHKVWILDCKSCATFFTNRAMKVCLFSTSPPHVHLHS